MRARKSLGKWLAAALVAAAGVVLSGCPHNNLIDGGGAGGPAGGSRGGNGEVKLIVTNFAADSGGGRSSSWLAPSRTIAPDHIDLKAEKDKYVFVAEGTSNGGETYGPEYITLEDDGSTSLGIAGGGIWTVTVSAYEATKLHGLGVGTTPTDIMQGKTAKEVKDGGDTALVLQGKATLDLGMNSTGSVTVTLTNDGVGTEGNVLVSVYFDDTDDKNKLNNNTGGDYSVKVGLYDFTTGALVGGNKEEEIKPAGETLGDPDVTNITDVPKGRYQFRVTVTEVATNRAVAYWVDDIYVEGNRDTEKEVHVSKLFDKPEEPTKAGVYWSRKDSGEAREGFLAYLSWEDMPFNAVGVDVQIADITKWYSSTNGTDDKEKLQGTGDQDITDAAALWQKIEQLPKAGAGGAGTQPTFEQVVTELKWSDFPQKATGYPIYKEGSLLNGHPGIVLLMQTGHVYTVRIRAAGGNDSSDWLPIDQTSTDAMGTEPEVIPNVPPAVPPAAVPQKASKFNDDKLRKGIFDLVMLKYSLQDKYELAKTDAGQIKGDKATENDLVVYSSYGDAITIELKYTNMTTPVQGDWFLYPLGAVPPVDINGRDKGWKGWKGENDPTQTFDATKGGGAGWGQYAGHTDLTLVPVGAGVGANIQANTADTFNVLTEDTVLVTLEADGNAAATAGFLELVNGDTNPNGGGGADVKTTGLGIQKDPAGDRYILNMDDAAKNKTAGNATWLYVSVGEDPAHPGTLNDKNGNEFTVQDIQVRILERGLITAKTFIKASSSVAYQQLDGMQSGTYELEVKVLSSTGYWETYKTPLAIKYNNQTIQ